jgi:hypothetical protein
VLLLRCKSAAMRVLFRDPKGKAPWYNGTGIVMYVTGMMISAFALHGGWHDAVLAVDRSAGAGAACALARSWC